MRSLIFIGIVALYVTVNSHAVPAPVNWTKPHLSNDEKEQSQHFVLDLARNFSSFYFDRINEYVGYNRILSPLSVLIPVSMLAYGSQGNTRDNFLGTILLSENDAQKAKHGFEILLEKLAKYDIRIKTRMFVPPGAKFNPNFVNLTSEVFNSENEIIDETESFTDSERINKWVADQTNNNVTEILKPHNIGPGSSFVLANTVYFKGIWKKSFDSSQTTLRRFYAFGTDPVDVPTMRTKDYFRHGRIEALGSSFIELPFKSNSENHGMSMIIVLPDKVEGDEWTNLIGNLRKLKPDILMNSTKKEVEVFLPKFRIETEESLNEFFRMIFLHNDPSSFSGVFDSFGLSRLGKSTTRIVVEVDEEGQEAAGSSAISYNSVESAPSCRRVRSITPEAIQFKVDHPFVAIITTNGELFTEIFSINFPGSQFGPERRII